MIDLGPRFGPPRLPKLDVVQYRGPAAPAAWATADVLCEVLHTLICVPPLVIGSSSAAGSLRSLHVTMDVSRSGTIYAMIIGVELWGARLFSDPCRDCGFDWSLSPVDAIAAVESAPRAFRAAASTADGSERLTGWSVSEYTSHVADNLRTWAERIQGARLGGVIQVGGYDPDALARARGYATLPLAAALWSLDISVAAWVDALSAGVAENIELHHATRGLQRASDITRNNAHDAHHHIWDIRQILSAAS